MRSTFCTRACKSESLRGSFVKTGTIRRRFACSPRKDDTRGSRSVDDTLFRLASRLFGPSANGNGTALFATAGVGAKLISERRHLLGRAGRNLISNAFASMGNSSGALCFSFASTSGARDSLGKGGQWSSAVASVSWQPLARGETLRARVGAERARDKHKANA